jgi:hypothetical protein
MRNRIRSALVAYLRASPAPPLTDAERLAQVWCAVWTAQKNINDDLRAEDIASDAWRSTTLGDAGKRAA